MRIAQVAPLYESVPPRLYGGTERVVSYIVEEQVAQGHEVTLYASGDSETAAKLVPGCGQALRLSRRQCDAYALHLLLIEQVLARAEAYDVIHFHTDYIQYPVTRRLPLRTLTTLHGRLDLPDTVTLYREFDDVPLVSISDDQRRPIAWANWIATVHHGLPSGLYRLEEQPADYLAFLGRISPEKRVDRAIRIAERAGMKIKIAAKIDDYDREYFESKIRRLFSLPCVEYVGEIGEHEKQEFLGGARALLFPIDWPEPFGLTMIEALACGTPVIAYPRGSVPEILEHGQTAYLVRSIDQAVRAVRSLGRLSRRRCREEFERRFLAERMAADYVALYESLQPETLEPRLAGLGRLASDVEDVEIEQAAS